MGDRGATERTAHRGVYVRRRGDGGVSVQAKWSTPDGTGGRRQHAESWHLPPGASKTKVNQAVDRAARWRWERLHGPDPSDRVAERMTVAELAERWYAGVPGRVRPSTAGNYRWQLDRVILPAFGGTRLAALGPLDVDAWLRGLETRRARSTCALALAVLRSVVRQGIAWRLLRYDPTLGARVGGTAPREARALSVAEAERLLDLMRDDPLHPLWRLLLLLGLRVGEALALDWGRVDLASRRILVASTVSRDADLKVTVLPGTKGGRARWVPLDPGTALALAALGRQAPGSPVFVGRRGRRLAASTVRGRLGRLLAAAGLGHRTVHSLRHSMVSLQRAAGVRPEVVAAVAGHSPAVMLRVYSHPTDDATREAVEALAKRLGG